MERSVAVRVNAPGSSELAADLELVREVRASRCLTVVVPKVDGPDVLVGIAALLGDAVGLQGLIETPEGIEAVAAIAGSTPQLEALILGYADLATALGRRGAERDIERWLYYQEAVLSAARGAGLQAIDGPFLRLGEPLSLARAARAARELGFDGKWAIHPEQVETLNRAFAATEREVRWAGAVTDALAASAGSGDAAVRVDGAMVDEAMRAQADRLLALPRRAGVAGSVAGWSSVLRGSRGRRRLPRPWTDGHARARRAPSGDRGGSPSAVAGRAAVPGGHWRAVNAGASDARV